MNQYFDLIKNSLQSIHVHTQLLEACGWDEDYLNQQLLIAQEFFTDYIPAENVSWEKIINDCRSFMENNLEESIIDIIIDMVNQHGKEITEFMKLEDN